MRQLLNEAVDKTRGEAIKITWQSISHEQWLLFKVVFWEKIAQKIPQKNQSSAIFVAYLRNEISTWLFYYGSVPNRFYNYAQSTVSKHLPFVHYIIWSAPAMIHISFVSFVLFFFPGKSTESCYSNTFCCAVEMSFQGKIVLDL